MRLALIWIYQYLLVISIFFGKSEAWNFRKNKNQEKLTYNDGIFQKYTYKSRFTDKELYQSTFTKTHLNKLKTETKDLFNYAFNKYMEFGFPYDEVLPLTCKPNLRDFKDQSNTVQNDSMGNFTITLFDSMDTFIIMGDKEGFHNSVKLIKSIYKDFAIDSLVQIFETNIRLLGSLLTAHLYAIDKRRGYEIDDYDGFLLKLAYDLGKRLVISFYHYSEDEKFHNSSPESDMDLFVFNFPRTNLLRGPETDMPNKLKDEQCAAGITSLTLEFSLLSRLTNDSIFEDVSTRAVKDYWFKRTDLDLITMGFDTTKRSFTTDMTGIGASVDSFYEYALKYSILFDDDVFYDIWKQSYMSLLTHSQNLQGIFTNLNINSGMGMTEWIDSLAAFFPGLQVLSGDLKNSAKLHLTYFKLWNNYGAIPERWNFVPIRSEPYFGNLGRKYREGDVIEGFSLDETNEILVRNSIGLEWYPLRPEFIESTYHLYTATKDPFYLRIGEDFLKKLREHFIAPCGFAGVSNILADTRQNRQESYVLSETLKYLYLLFDTGNQVQNLGNTIFTTEGHPIWFDKKVLEYDPIKKDELDSMNYWNKTEDVQKGGFLERILHSKKFNLNKEFESFKEYYYKKIANHDQYIVKMVNVPVFEQMGAMPYSAEYPHGTLFKVNKAGYEQYKHMQRHVVNHINKKIENGSNGVSGTYFDADYLNLDTCDVIKNDREKGIFSSDLMNFGRDLYRLDWDYSLTLRKPLYLLNKRELELEDLFYSRFVDYSTQCQREQTTYEWEALISLGNSFSIAPIMALKAPPSYKTGKTDDGNKVIYIWELQGLRLRFEDLDIGGIDYHGDVITSDTINRAIRHENANIANDDNGCYELPKIRLRKVNGLALEQQDIVFVDPGSKILEESQNLGVSCGCLVLDGKLVVNVRV